MLQASVGIPMPTDLTSPPIMSGKGSRPTNQKILFQIRKCVRKQRKRREKNKLLFLNSLFAFFAFFADNGFRFNLIASNIGKGFPTCNSLLRRNARWLLRPTHASAFNVLPVA
jgi:hypothetical protein